ncbi:hypothetical protein [Brumimicrobium mesophilum]|uniref:hypothetical protein n=1 Tax=Brumimicrobium mesophilum TaxID=392717 RepID=UPI000D144AFE|nr:hypothetical protein [Brumimicrobium mesophilum]
MRICKVCNKRVVGRTDKIFCSIKCKNNYHVQLRSMTAHAALDIDKILHRNRSIILELLGNDRDQLHIDRIEMDKKNFHFNYYTHQYMSREGDTFKWLYDLGWIELSNREMIILRE